MEIANPIYDVVFKYLMEDAKIAKLLISSIIGEEIESLDFRPQEFTSDIETGNLDGRIHTLTVYRLDFSATIKTDDGTKQVLIEIQKAKYATDIMRFREYLGGQYSNKNNTELATIRNHSRRVGIPIIGIYFLGHTLDHTDASIIGVQRIYKDLVTGEQITAKESFIESLSHDSYVIQIPNLAHKRRNDLEKLLSIFDQSTSVDAAQHILNIKEEDYPEKYRLLIRRLQSAVLEPSMRKQMQLEDSVLLDIEDRQRDFIRRIAEAEQQIAEAEQQIAEAEQKATEAEQQIAEAEQKAAQQIAETEQKASEKQKNVVTNLKQAGVAVEVIMQATGLSKDEVESL